MLKIIFKDGYIEDNKSGTTYVGSTANKLLFKLIRQGKEFKDISKPRGLKIYERK